VPDLLFRQKARSAGIFISAAAVAASTLALKRMLQPVGDAKGHLPLWMADEVVISISAQVIWLFR
jgi:hypothetical protein